MLLGRHDGADRGAGRGQGLAEYPAAGWRTVAAAVLNLGRIRSRSKLIYVGLFAGARGRCCFYVAMRNASTTSRWTGRC